MQLFAKCCAVLILVMFVGAIHAHAETLTEMTRSREIVAEALKARAAKQSSEYLKLMQEAFQLRPNMPGMMVRLAGAYSVNGEKDKSIDLLGQVARMGVSFNLAKDTDFANLKDDSRFRSVADTMSTNLQPLIKSEAAFELAEKDFLPEGLAYDAKTKSFFVASVHQRKIVKRLSIGDVKPLSVAADGLWSVLAIAVDSKRRVLWAASSAMGQTRDIDEKDIGRTAIFKYSLDNEKLLATIELPRTAIKRSFGDLLVASNGDLYISESLEGGIYRIAGGKLELFVAPGTFASPQGMVWQDKGKWLYVADYSLGLLRVDMQSRKTEWLPPPADSCLLGLDALTRFGNKLIATQNGINPHRVVEIALNAQGHIEKVSTLEANHPRHREPTLGVVVGNDFFYVANSQWEFFERGKTPPVEQLSVPLILRLPLATKQDR